MRSKGEAERPIEPPGASGRKKRGLVGGPGGMRTALSSSFRRTARKLMAGVVRGNTIAFAQ